MGSSTNSNQRLCEQHFLGRVGCWGRYLPAAPEAAALLPSARSLKSEVALCKLSFWGQKELVPWFALELFEDARTYLVVAWVLFVNPPFLHFPVSRFYHHSVNLHGRVCPVWPFTQPCGNFVKRRRKEWVCCLSDLPTCDKQLRNSYSSM